MALEADSIMLQEEHLEAHFLFDLSPGSYVLHLAYDGVAPEQGCVYYSANLAIAAKGQVRKRSRCSLESEDLEIMDRMEQEKLPDSIAERDLLGGLYNERKYGVFKAENDKRAHEIRIQLREDFDLAVGLVFDRPLQHMTLELLQEDPKTKKRRMALGAQSPIEPTRGAYDSERSMQRSLRQRGLKANTVYILRLQDAVLSSVINSLSA